MAGSQQLGEDMLVPDGVQSAYRSELTGILGGLRFVDSLVHVPTEARFICDGKAALEVSFGIQPLGPQTPQLDLLQPIRKSCESVRRKGVVLKPTHVKGHADDTMEMEELSEDQRLNVQMDERAKAFWSKMEEQGWPVLGAPKLLGSCCVRIAQKVVIAHSSKRLYTNGTYVTIGWIPRAFRRRQR